MFYNPCLCPYHHQTLLHTETSRLRHGCSITVDYYNIIDQQNRSPVSIAVFCTNLQCKVPCSSLTSTQLFSDENIDCAFLVESALCEIPMSVDKLLVREI